MTCRSLGERLRASILPVTDMVRQNHWQEKGGCAYRRGHTVRCSLVPACRCIVVNSCPSYLLSRCETYYL